MNFQEIVNKSFLRKQKKIKKINIENFNFYNSHYSTIIILLLTFGFSLSFFATYLSILGIVGIILLFIFSVNFVTLKHKKIIKISEKLNKEKYKILLNQSQYIAFNNKLKKCNYNEFLDNQKIIFKYIETLSLHQQQNSLNIISEKINLHENLMKNTKKIVEKQAKEKQKNNINSNSNKVLLKNI